MQDRSRPKIFPGLTYEHKSEPLLAREKYLKRVLNHFLTAFGVLGLSLFIGIVGYRFTEDLTWIDSLLNASMILGGMGPVDPILISSQVLDVPIARHSHVEQPGRSVGCRGSLVWTAHFISE